MSPGDANALDAIRVLVVDDEVNLRFAIERGLRKSGHHADSASTVRQGIERLRTAPYDVVLTDLRMPGGDGEQLVQWLGSYSPSTRIVVMSAFVTPEFRREYDHSSVRIIEKPVELADLVRLVESIGPRRGFFGNSIEVELFDYVQMVAIAGRDKWIEVSTPLGKGHIWFEHGDIVHASAGSLTGERAFYKILSAGRGAFKEVFFRAPPDRTIVRSATHLLMEAARMIDEGTIADEVDEAPDSERRKPEDSASFADIAAALSRDSRDSVTRRPPMSVTEELLLPADDDAPPESIGSEEELLLPADDELQRGRRIETRPPSRPETPPPTTRERADVRTHAASSSATMGAEGVASLDRFLSIDGVAGAAIISSTGKVLAEDMRGSGALVTLAGFYLRGAARIARQLGDSVFDTVVSRSVAGDRLVMVSMGVMTAVLAVARDADPERVRERATELAA